MRSKIRPRQTEEVLASSTGTAAMASPQQDPNLLLSRLSKNAELLPDKQAVAFITASGQIEQSYTYRELDDTTSKLARLLISKGILPGDRAVLVYPPCLDFGVAFIACLKARIVAVPVFPPNPTRRDTLAMFCKIVEGCGATVALTNTTYNHAKKLGSLKDALKLKAGGPKWPDNLTWIDTTIEKKVSNEVKLPTSPSVDTLAFLQYTSGSTSTPKGVMISHGNLKHNLTIITNELKAKEDTIVVSWLPQYHDMGLIGSLMGCIYCGGSGYYMSPISFLQRPMLWIESVSKYKATHLQAPNFAFKLTARKFTKSKLDLSSVRHVINAAEPVDVDSMNTFYEVFGPHGFQRVIYPTYGLAEHTVFVCSGGKHILHCNKEELETNRNVIPTEETADGCSTLVGCGYPARQNVSVVIVDTDRLTSLPDNKVGEIWIRSDSKAQGYFGKPKETQEDFLAQLDGLSDYLRTGDLGFMHENELFICGRLKDLIIIGGRNYYPQDIEATAEAVSDKVRLGCSAAFTLDSTKSGDEEVVLVMELKEIPNNVSETGRNLASTIKAAVTQEHSLNLTHIVFLEPRTVPKTSSGKIARAWCRTAFLSKSLKIVSQKSFRSTVSALEIEDSPSRLTGPSEKIDTAGIRAMSKTDLVSRLRRDISRVANVEESEIDTNVALVSMLDSLTISQFKGLFERNYASKISDEYLFRDSTTVQKLADVAKLGHAPDDEGGTLTDLAPDSPGRAKGLAGALGCPPGVVCVIL